MSVSVSPEQVFELTALQSGMVFQSLLCEGQAELTGFNIQQCVLALPEAVPAQALREAWSRMSARHPILRAEFAWEGHSLPVMRLDGHISEIEITEHDWVGLDAQQRHARRSALLEADRKRGFDLRRAPLCRFQVCSVDARSVELIWSYHHILLDGRSFQIALAELVSLMRALRDGNALELPPAPRPITEFSTWIAARDHTQSRAFFHELLRGKSAPTPLPGAESLALETREACVQTTHLDLDASARLRALAEASGTTLGTVVQAMWALLLARWTGEEDVLFGNTRACRRSALDGNTGDMLGMFINTLPIRAQCGDSRSLRELLHELRAHALALRSHEHTPLIEVQAACEIPRGTALFETVVMFESRELNQELQARDSWWARCKIEMQEQPGPPLVLTVFGGEQLKLRLLYDWRRFRPSTIERILAHLSALLARMPGHLDQPLGSLECIPEDRKSVV